LQAAKSELAVISSEVGHDFSGNATTRFMPAPAANKSRKQVLDEG
jgi:hypothetical protein